MDQPPQTCLFTVFTPTYQRASSIHRVFDSLCAQTLRDFEWIVVDDGSTDGTRDVVESFRERAIFPINYIRQEHGGKHRAWNRAVAAARGTFFVIADSDDAFLPESLARFMEMWETIPEGERSRFRGCSCRCQLEDGTPVGGRPIPSPWLDAAEPDAKFRHHLRYELWGMTRTDVMRSHPLPEPEGFAFYPETIVWDAMATSYLTRYFNDALRVFYHDQGNSVTAGRSARRYRENYPLWQHRLNDLMRYFRYEPMMFVKAAVGIVRDGMLAGKGLEDVLGDVHPAFSKTLVILGTIPGVLLYLRARHNTKAA